MRKDERRPEDKVREGLEGFRAQLFTKYGEKGAKRILVGVPLAFLGIILLIGLLFFMPIRGVEVTGDVSTFNEGEIIAAAEIEEGDSLLLRSGGSIKRAIRKNLPLAENIKVRKTLFGIVKIDIEFDDVDFYSEVDGKFYALNESLRVMDISDSASKYSVSGAAKLIIPEVREPVLGEALVFYDTVEETDTNGELLYPVKPVSYYAFVTDFLAELKYSGYSEKADGIIINEKFAITIIYEMKYKICFGMSADLDSKFKVLTEILADSAMGSMEKVYIDLTNPSKATARPDNDLDFSEFED